MPLGLRTRMPTPHLERIFACGPLLDRYRRRLTEAGLAGWAVQAREVKGAGFAEDSGDVLCGTVSPRPGAGAATIDS